MKELIIIDAGGMGRSVYCIALGCMGYGTEFVVKGFIDDNVRSLDGFDGYPPVLSTIDGYCIEANDVFVCSLGNVKVKKDVCARIKKRGGNFFTLIHKTAIVRLNARIGEGCIVADYASIGADALVGDNTLVQSYAVVAHDCVVGNHVRIDTHCVCIGGVKIEDEATIHTGAVLSHNVTVGRGACVGATSLVFRKVKEGSTVFGNPSKLLK